MDVPDISIVLPVYNGEKYLRESLNSIISQSYGDFELIVWIDGSRDNSTEIIRQYQDRRIRVFSNATNQGLFKSLNLAIQQARGKWVRLWSQDDVMKPDCLREEMEFHKHYPDIGMSYCAFDVVDCSGKIIRRPQQDRTPDVIPPELATQIMLYYGSITGNIANVAIKRSVLNEVGFFCEDMLVSGDFDMWVRITEKYSIGFIRRPLIYLRSHKDQLSRQKDVYTAFMHEGSIINEMLVKRLPIEIVEYAKAFIRRHHHLQHVHFMIRCLISGDFKNALKTYKALCELDNPIRMMGLWFITGDGHFFKMKPKFLAN